MNEAAERADESRPFLIESGKPGSRSEPSYQFGPFLVNAGERTLTRQGERVSLTPKAFETLLTLVRRAGRVVTKEELIDQVWPNTFVDENNLTQNISALRKALGESADKQVLIETAPRLGYRFVAPINEIASGNGDLPLLRHSPPGKVVTEEEDEQARRLPLAEESAASLESPIPAEGFGGIRKYFWYYVVGALAVIAGLAVWVWAAFQPAGTLVVSNYVRLTESGAATDFLSTDGLRIYYTTANGRVGHLSVTGGEPLLVPSAVESIFPFALSRKRQELLVGEVTVPGAEPLLWELPLPAGSPRRLGNLSAHDATYSPDDEKIAFANGNIIYVARSDGSAAQEICNGVVWPRHLRWSPDGKVIRFKGFDRENAALWEVSATGSQPRIVLSGGNGNVHEKDFEGDWTPDGQYFIYPLLKNGRSDLWTLRERESLVGGKRNTTMQLTNGPISWVAAVPSPDGKKLYAAGRLERGELARYDSMTQQFQTYIGGVSADSLAFSRDGQRVAYSSFPERTLWTSRVDGLVRQQLTFAPMQALLPSWSPDGTRIAFMGHTTGKPWKIYIIPAKGGTLAPLTTGDQDEGNPTWSPDGKSLAFAGVPWMRGFDPASTAIRVMNLASGRVSLLPGSEGLWSPRWSHDGRYLVAEGSDSKTLRFYDFHVRRWSPAVHVADRAIGYTSWSSDSRFVYFNEFSREGNAIYRLGVTDHDKALVLDLGAVQLAETLGQWFTLAPDGSLLVLRDLTAREVYSLDLQFR